MNYDLAKQLKDTGFPQSGNGFFGTNSKTYAEVKPRPFNSNKGAYQPTLEELIDACGKEFGELLRVYNYEGEILSWEAKQRHNPEKYIDIIEVEGITKEEAVAKLWLELNNLKSNK